MCVNIGTDSLRGRLARPDDRWTRWVEKTFMDFGQGMEVRCATSCSGLDEVRRSVLVDVAIGKLGHVYHVGSIPGGVTIEQRVALLI